MKRLIPLLLTAMAIIFASVGLGYSYMASNFSGIKTTEEKKERKVYTRGDGTKAELVEQNPWLFRQYIVSIPTPEIIAVPAQEVKKQDFSPNADTVIDENGYQTIPDNSTVTDITTRKLRTKYFTLWIPGCWVGNVVAECRYIDVKSDESTNNDAATKDTISLRFYEKQNYETYVSNEDNEYPYATGLITELRYTSTGNDNEWLKTSNYETYVGDCTLGTLSYNLFLYEIHNSNDLTRPEFEKTYMYLTKVNYSGCIIASFKITGGGTIKYTKETKKGYIDTWDTNSEGMPLNSEIPEDGLLASERDNMVEDSSEEEDGSGEGLIPQPTGEGDLS